MAVELDRTRAQVADAPAEHNPTERARRLELLGDVEVRASLLAFKLATVARLDKRPADADQLMEVARSATARNDAARAEQAYASALESRPEQTRRNLRHLCHPPSRAALWRAKSAALV